MLTLKLRYHSNNTDFITSQMKNYNTALRIVYNNLDLTQDPGFIAEIRERYGLSACLYRFIVKEAEAWHAKWSTRHNDIQERIDAIEAKFADLPRYKRSFASKKLNFLYKTLHKELCFGSAKLARELAKNPHDKELREQWKNKRLWSMTFVGESNQKANRFFCFKQLAEGVVVFKPEGTGEKVVLNLMKQGHKRQAILNKLQFMALKKQIPITVSLDETHICLSYDEQILCGTHFDKRAAWNQLKHIQDKEVKRMQMARLHRKHEELLFSNKKPTRFMGFDFNPEGIGFCIADRLVEASSVKPKVIYQEFIDFKELHTRLKVASNHKSQKKQNNKRKYELCVAVKKIFDLASYFKVSHVVTEDLNFKQDDLKSKGKEFNRKTKNLWCRELIDNLFTKHVNERGMKRVEVIAAYSSFIGNCIHDCYDPIAASIELCRRGMVKYIKGSSIFPEFDVDSLFSDLEDKISNEMHEQARLCETYQELYAVFLFANYSVRRGLEASHRANWMKSEKSGVRRIVLC